MKYFSRLGIFSIAIAIILIGFGIIYAATTTENFTNEDGVSKKANITIDTLGGGSAFLSKTETWTCGDKLVDERDGKFYDTVLIGAQCWMQENLNVGTMIPGSNNQGTSAIDIDKYCYSNSETNCTNNGGLYQWNQAMAGSTTAGAQGICPAGWHIPTHDEFTTLERAVCTSGTCETDFPYDTTTTGWRGTDEGTTLKSTSGLFKGLLSGYRVTNGSFVNVGSYGYFWSSVQSVSSAWFRQLSSSYASVYRVTVPKAFGFSLRCLKD